MDVKYETNIFPFSHKVAKPTNYFLQENIGNSETYKNMYSYITALVASNK